MKNSWLVWIFIVGMVVTILIAFNYQGAQDTVPLSEIFPETETYPVEIEYVDDQPVSQPNANETAMPIKTSADKMIVSAIQEEAPEPIVNSPITVIQETKKIEPVKSAVLQKDAKYTIQIASYKDKVNAEKKISELEKKDYKAFLVSKELKDKGTWHRVYVGSFSTKKEADDYLTKVKKDYSGSFVISAK
ncbi:MAG: SPOR domain-containing protein [Candidatus Omnitrophota bacterium]